MSMRSLYLVSFLIACGLLGVGLYTQFVEGIMPCPLCYLQRFAFIMIVIACFIGTLFWRNKYARNGVNIVLLVFSLAGFLFAARQVWLQHFPPANSQECGVSFGYMMQALPLTELAQKVMAGSAECTNIGWRFLGLNMAEWSTVWFSLFLILSFYLLFKKKPSNLFISKI